MPRNRWLTPDIAPTDTICRRILIPNSKEWIATVAGALQELCFAYNYEEFGTATPDDTADRFRVMVDDFTFNGTCRMIGEIIAYAGATSPDIRWLDCDGSSLLRADFPDLFNVIGTTYGAADGSHFNLPELRGRTVVGIGSGTGLTPRALGDSFGEEEHTLTASEVPTHTHTDAGHTHAESTSAPSVGAAITGVPVPSAISSVGITGSGSASLDSAGGDGSHNNIQPSIALAYLIVALP